jgi:hypothetical protein
MHGTIPPLSRIPGVVFEHKEMMVFGTCMFPTKGFANKEFGLIVCRKLSSLKLGHGM